MQTWFRGRTQFLAFEAVLFSETEMNPFIQITSPVNTVNNLILNHLNSFTDIFNNWSQNVILELVICAFANTPLQWNTPTRYKDLWTSGPWGNSVPSRNFHSASERRFIVPSQRGTKSLSQTFSLTVPIWWNNLPNSIRAAESLPIFKNRLKHISSIFIWPSISSTLYYNSIL